jgi:hypothetical protein
MFEALALTAVLTAGPELPDPVHKGVKHHAGASMHRGARYAPKHERLRKCIRQRESNNFYNAVSRTGTYRGAYQFSPALTVGAAWMIQKQLRATHGKQVAVEIGRALRSAPMNQWAIYWQDRAFWTIWNNGKGRKHWAATVPGTECK